MAEKKNTRVYRIIELAMWGDERFRKLSRPKPNGQTIWQFLLTGPYTIAIPGIVVCKPMMIASYYDWDSTEALRKAFREAFAEVLDAGLIRVDSDAGLMWIPGAAKPHRASKPASPNVVKGWPKHWVDVPECTLKRQALQGLRTLAEGLGEAFSKAFREAFPEAYCHPYPNQEQEQEQEQEHKKNSSSLRIDASPTASKPKKASKKKKSEVDPARFEEAYKYYPRKVGKAKGIKLAQAKITTEAEFLIFGKAMMTLSKTWANSTAEDREFLPHFDTFVRNERWKEELPVPHSTREIEHRKLPPPEVPNNPEECVGETPEEWQARKEHERAVQGEIR